MSPPDERSFAPNRHARLIAATKETPTRDATAARAVSLGAARPGGFVGPPRSDKRPLVTASRKWTGMGCRPPVPSGSVRQGEECCGR
jgi:hypothetical protein